MKVAVIGKGTSAIITVCNLLKRNHDVDIFYDPDKPHITVGESTTPHIGGLLNEVFNISIFTLINEKIVSLKTGVNFINWGNNESFMHDFVAANQVAFHFDTEKFNPFMHQLIAQRGVKYFAEKVQSLEFNQGGAFLNGKQYDFVVNCSGWDNDNTEYREPIIETVNSAVLYRKESILHHNKTLHEATEDGWQFGLPFPDLGFTRHGYLFNDKLSDIKLVKEKFKNIDHRVVQWKPKYSKDLVHNPFYASNGNRLFFSEPLQALSLMYYNVFANCICEYLDKNYMNTTFINHTNNRYSIDMFEYQISLCWHYSYGSKYKTNFWNTIQEKSKYLMELNPTTQKDFIDRCLQIESYPGNKILNIGTFVYSDYVQIDMGMKNLK